VERDSKRGSSGGRTQFAPTGATEWVWRGEGGHHATVRREIAGVTPDLIRGRNDVARAHIGHLALDEIAGVTPDLQGPQ